MLDGVVHWSLPIVVDVVEICAKINQLLRRRDVAFSDAVENRRLTVSVHVVHRQLLLNEPVDESEVAFSYSIIQWSLVERVRLGCADSEISESF